MHLWICCCYWSKLFITKSVLPMLLCRMHFMAHLEEDFMKRRKILLQISYPTVNCFLKIYLSFSFTMSAIARTCSCCMVIALPVLKKVLTCDLKFFNNY